MQVLELVGVEWETKVFAREHATCARKALENGGDVDIVALDQVYRGFLEVSDQTRSAAKSRQDVLKRTEFLRNRVDEDSAPSAYNEVRILAASKGIGDRTPLSVAMSRMRCKGSMARMNSIGERGSPWRTP